jgi:hypothetical protein
MLWGWNDVSATVGDSRQVIDDQDGVVGYQAIVGVSFPITSVPGLSLTAEYRYYNEFGDPELKAKVTTTTTGTTSSKAIAIGNYGHSGLIGLTARVRSSAKRLLPADRGSRVLKLTGTRIALVQPTTTGSFRSAVPMRWRRNSCAVAYPAMKSSQTAWARKTTWCRQPMVCVNRRIAASKSS